MIDSPDLEADPTGREADPTADPTSNPTSDPTSDRQLLAAVVARAQLGRDFLLALERELGAAGCWIDTGYYFDEDVNDA